MISYHLFWILYAGASLLGWHEYNAYDCQQLSIATKQETTFIGNTCYYKVDSDGVAVLKIAK